MKLWLMITKMMQSGDCTLTLTKYKNLEGYKAYGTDLSNSVDDIPTSIIGVDGVKEMGPVPVKSQFECIQGARFNYMSRKGIPVTDDSDNEHVLLGLGYHSQLLQVP